MKEMLHRCVAFLLALVLVGLSACAPATNLPAASGRIEIDQAVVRLSGASMDGMNDEMPLAGYMRIKNNGPTDDTLTSIQANFAGKAILHESTVDSNGV